MQTPPFLLGALYNPGQYLLSPCIGSFKECLPDKQDVIEGSSTSPPILLRHQPSSPSSPSSPASCSSPASPFLIAHYLRAEVTRVSWWMGSPGCPPRRCCRQTVAYGKR